MDKGHNFLHNHPMTEKNLGLDEQHVIVDRDAWEEARRQVLNLGIPHVSEPLLWKDILDDFYVEHDKQISNGEYKGRMILVFKDWLEKNFEVPKRNVR